MKNNWKKDIESICDWFAENKLSIPFGYGKTLLFATNFKRKEVGKLNIKYGDIQIKPHFKVNI